MYEILIGLISAAAYIVTAFVIFILITLFFRKNEKLKRLILPLAVFLCLVTFLSITVSKNIPALKDELKLTALDERNDKSNATEIILTDIKVDGKSIDIPEPVEGKWFFVGSGYMWRPNSDARRPVETTQSVVLKIPVGFERNISFNKGDWSGKVKIECGDYTEIADTNTQSVFWIGHSAPVTFILNFVCRYVFFCLLMLLFSGVFLAYTVVFAGKKGSEEMRSRMLYIGIALASFAYMIFFSKNHTFWLDEMYQLGFSGTGKSLFETLMVTETTPPVFRLVANLWYNVAPYGEEWLLLLPEFFCMAAVYLTGRLGETVYNRTCGLIAAVFVAVSSSVFVSGAYEFRAYGMLLMLFALHLLIYTKRLKQGRDASLKMIILQIITMTLLAYSHYFGVFLCALCGLFDFVLLILKKVRFRVLLSYIVTAVLYVPWIMRLLQLNQIMGDASWMSDPSLSTLHEMFEYLCSEHFIPQILFLVGLIVIIYRYYRGLKDSDAQEINIPLISVLLFVSFIACMYLYGNVVNTTATLWVKRYFIGLIPLAGIIAAVGADTLASAVQKLFPEKKALKSIICVAVIFTLFAISFPVIAKQPFSKNHGVTQVYDKAADWIYDRHTNIFSERTLVLYADEAYIADSWNEYYLTKQGKREPVNVECTRTLIPKLRAEDNGFAKYFDGYDTVYLCYMSRAVPKDINAILTSNSFELTEENTDLRIRTYKRIQG
jgi:hypothetical protein